MWPDLIDCLESDLPIKNKVSYLNTLINVHGLNLDIENEIALVKNKVKEFCADATTRTEGLLLLYAVVHCSSTLYVDNWSQIVLGSLKCPDSIIPREIPLKVLKRMLINFASDSDYNDVFSKVISDILPIILNPEDEKVYKLYCQSLAVCMKYVPEIVATRVADIEKLLLKELDNPYGEVIEAIGECFAALPLCAMHMQKTGVAEYKKTWCNIFTKFINTMHSLLNDILKLSEDQPEYVDVSDLPTFELPSSESNNNVPVLQIDIFKSLCQCMAKMMSSENRLVCLPITELFNTLHRLFDVEKIIQHRSQDPTIGYLKLGFPQMLNGLNVVMEAVVLNFSILEQSQNFVTLMNMSLDAMNKGFPQSSVSQVRGSTWKLINVWLKHYGSKASCQLSKNKNILTEILTDINIEEIGGVPSKQLKVSNVKEKNQKANQVFACTHALKVLKTLVETSANYVPKEYLDEISSTLLRTAKIVLKHMLPKKHFPFPYSDEKCRKMLYDVLFMYSIYSDPLHSKCILEAINICNVASRDASVKIGRLCHRFRKLSRYYLNPRKPPPDAIQYSHPNMIKIQQPIIENVRSEWSNGMEWNNANGRSSDDQMDDNETSQAQENAYSDKVESESDLVAIDQIEETEGHINNEYRRVAKQSSQSISEEESNEDSDIEPTYVSTDSNPIRIGLNDSSHINSFGMQSCVEQYGGETRTERQVSEAVVPNLTNNVENNIEEHVSAFVEVESTEQKPTQVPVGNGEWKKKENATESEEDESDMEEEGDEEGEANEEISDNAADEASEGKRSPEFDEERPRKRQKCLDEEDEDMDEEVEDEDIPANNQSSDEEGNEVNNISVLEHNTATKSANLIEDESQDDIDDTKSPSLREMCHDFVLAEPAIADTS